MTAIALEAKRRASAPPTVWLWRLCMAVALAAVAIPPLVVRLPPLLDYPNHYVRIWLLSGGVHTQPLSSFYAIDWRAAWTNVGVDLIARLLGPLIGVHALAPLLLTAATVLPPLGAVVLNQRLYPGWRPWQVGIPLAAWATTLLAGFLNYQIGLGLALVAAALDPWVERRASPAQLLIVRIVVATALLVIHIFALGFYALLLGGLAIGPSLAVLREPDGPRRVALRILAVAGAVALPLLAYALTAPALPGHGALAPIWGPATWQYKLDVLLCAFATYDARIDGLFFGVLALIVGVAAGRKLLDVHHGLLIGVVGLIVLALIFPTWAAETGWIDTRLPIMALLTLLAAVNPRLGVSGRPAAAMAAGLLALVAARAAWIGHIWELRQSDVRSIERALAEVPPGATVMPIEHRPSVRGKAAAPPGRYFHMGTSFFHQYTLAVMDRRAFSPLVFTQPGKQPLRVRAAWKDISVPNGGRSPTFNVLKRPNAEWRKIAPYVDHWRERFDYALMLNADLLENVDDEVPPDGLTLIANQGFARLYKVEKPDDAAEADAEDDSPH